MNSNVSYAAKKVAEHREMLTSIERSLLRIISELAGMSSEDDPDRMAKQKAIIIAKGALDKIETKLGKGF